MKYSFSGITLLIVIMPIVITLKITALTGCANQIPPTGGPRDSLPPVLISATPPDSSKTFVAKKITFVFNEFVQLNNIQQNLLVSPVPKINPTVEARLRTVTVQLKDTLEPNTTYTLNFGDALADITEGNLLKDFTYIFSTGPSIDSLDLSGRVILAETGKIDTTLIVLLHKSLDDSALIKDRPRYVTRLDGNGNFTFYNLPSGTFALYALKDDGGMRRYQSKSQLFAFADKPIVIEAATTPVTLYAYTEKEESKTSIPSLPRPTGVKGVVQDKRLRLETNLENEQLDILKPLEIYFKAAPLKYFDSSRVRFTNEKYESVPNFSIVKDTSDQKVILTHPWTENTTYNLILDKDFAEDSVGRKLLRNDTITWKTKKLSEYGLVRLRFLNLDLTKNPVLLFVQNNEIKFTHPFTTKEFSSPLFTPGEYELRILYDENKNGKWDPGEFFGKHKQPELVQPISRRLTVKANWDNEIDIAL